MNETRGSMTAQNEITEFNVFCARLGQFQVQHGIYYKIIWRWTANGVFSVKTVYTFLKFRLVIQYKPKQVWKSFAPSWENVFR